MHGGAFAMPGEAMVVGSDSRMLFIAARALVATRDAESTLSGAQVLKLELTLEAVIAFALGPSADF